MMRAPAAPTILGPPTDFKISRKPLIPETELASRHIAFSRHMASRYRPVIQLNGVTPRVAFLLGPYGTCAQRLAALHFAA